MSYNGWSNKETWLVNLWLGDMLSMDQEEGIEITENYIESQVEYFVEQSRPKSDASEMLVNLDGFMLDMLNCALGEINYYEISQHYAEEG